MKLWGLALVVAGVAFANWQAPTTTAGASEYVFFLSGDAQGYLSPCGCSTPMIGGTKRRATALERLGVKGRTIFLENGGLVKKAGRQDEIKLETFAQLHAIAHGGGMNLSTSEGALGPGALLSMSRLSGNRLLSASIGASPLIELPASRVEGPFLIGGVTSKPDNLAATLGAEPIALEAAVEKLLNEATSKQKSLALMLDGSREDAVKLAEKFPRIALIQYRSAGRPVEKVEKVGTVALASPGDGGRYVVRLLWKNGAFDSYLPVELDPGFSDNPGATEIYKTYLKRLGGEGLLEKEPRMETGKYVGNEACGKCHGEAEKIWKNSKHSHALETLEKEGHDRDPDCVECHVVALTSLYGFKSRKETPNLTDVGCESCHGAGAAHSADPKIKMGKVGEEACMSCHKVENSPKFDFKTYWEKIKH